MSVPTSVLVAAMLLCAFLIDRVIAAGMFIASYRKAAGDKSSNGATTRHELRKTLVYFFFSGILAVVAVMALGLRLDLSAFPTLGHLSGPITWIILVAGAERISAFVGLGSAPSAPPVETEGVEVQVSGTLRIDPATARKIEQAAAE
jgi:hypothetical protein